MSKFNYEKLQEEQEMQDVESPSTETSPKVSVEASIGSYIVGKIKSMFQSNDKGPENLSLLAEVAVAESSVQAEPDEIPLEKRQKSTNDIVLPPVLPDSPKAPIPVNASTDMTQFEGRTITPPASTVSTNVGQTHRDVRGPQTEDPNNRPHGPPTYKDVATNSNKPSEQIQASSSPNSNGSVPNPTCGFCGSIKHSTEQCRTPQCYKCAEFGHIARSCTKKVCSLCGLPGHFRSNCKTAPGARCRFCSNTDHFTGQCKQKKLRRGASNATRSARNDHLIAQSVREEHSCILGESDAKRDLESDKRPDHGGHTAVYRSKYASSDADKDKIAKLKSKISDLEDAIRDKRDLESAKVFSAFAEALKGGEEEIYIKYSTWEYDKWNQSASHRVFATPMKTIFMVILIFFVLYVINIPLSLTYMTWSRLSPLVALLVSVLQNCMLFGIIVVIDMFRCVILERPSWFGQGDFTEVWVSKAFLVPPIGDARNDRKQTDELVHANPLCVRVRTRRTVNRWVSWPVEHRIASLELIAQCGGADFMPINATPQEAYNAISTTIGRECKTNINRYAKILGDDIEIGSAYVCYALWMQMQNTYSVLDFHQGQAIKV